MGARSIGIGHPRSGDRCTTPHPAPLDPARASPSSHHPSLHPARGAFFVARVSEGRSPDDPGYATDPISPRPRQGSVVMALVRGSDTLSGSHSIRHIAANPGSSALRASTTGLCRSDPYRGPLPGSLLGMAYTSVSGTSCLDRCLWNGHPSDSRRLLQIYHTRLGILSLWVSSDPDQPPFR